MKIFKNLEVNGSVRFNTLPNNTTSLAMLVYANNIVQQRTVGTIITKNINDYLASFSTSFPNIFTATTSVTPSTPSLSVALNAQLQNTVFASPTTSAGTPSFRKLVLNDFQPTIVTQLTNAVTNTHTHANISVLNGISAIHIANWNTAHSSIGLPLTNLNTTNKTSLISAINELKTFTNSIPNTYATINDTAQNAENGKRFSVKSADNRNINYQPTSYYKSGVFFEFKKTNVVGFSSSYSHGALITFAPWTSDSGNNYVAYQLYHSNGLLGYRTWLNATFGAWKILADRDWVTENSLFKISSQGGIFTKDWNSHAIGLQSLSIGHSTISNAKHTTSVGNNLFTNGYGSANFGTSNSVQKPLGFSIGAYNSTNASLGATIGIGLINNSYGTMVVGRYNLPHKTSNYYEPTNIQRIFIIGSGRNESNRKNAFEVYENGRVFKSWISNHEELKETELVCFREMTDCFSNYISNYATKNLQNIDTNLTNTQKDIIKNRIGVPTKIIINNHNSTASNQTVTLSNSPFPTLERVWYNGNGNGTLTIKKPNPNEGDEIVVHGKLCKIVFANHNVISPRNRLPTNQVIIQTNIAYNIDTVNCVHLRFSTSINAWLVLSFNSIFV